MDVIACANYFKGAMWASLSYHQRTAAFATIMVYVLLDNTLSADKIFTIYQYFGILQTTLGGVFPKALQFRAEGKVSVARIQVD